jgi:superfamily II DNA or RNA helicase
MTTQELLSSELVKLSVSINIKSHISRIVELKEQLKDELTKEDLESLSAATKSTLQLIADIKINENGGFGLIAMATGTGKSKIAINRVVTAMAIKENAEILIVVPTEKLRDEGWMFEFEKWGCGSLYPYVKTVCYASLANIKDEEWDLVIFDEAHNITPNNSQFFKNNIIRSAIALTATPPESKVKQKILSDNGLKTVFEVTLDEAIDLGVAAPYDITIVTVPLDDKDKYVRSGKHDKPFFQTEKAKYDYLTNSVMFGTNPNAEINRMAFLGQLRSKTITAANILKRVIPEDIRTLIFCATKEQAANLCEHHYYSKPTPPKKLGPKPTALQIKTYNEKFLAYQKALEIYSGDKDYDDFVNMLITKLACVDAVNEGHNIPTVRCALIVKLNSKKLDFRQRLGRIVRFTPGHIGKVIILVSEGTVDEKWAMQATGGLRLDRIRWIKLDDLRNARETITF